MIKLLLQYQIQMLKSQRKSKRTYDQQLLALLIKVRKDESEVEGKFIDCQEFQHIEIKSNQPGIQEEEKKEKEEFYCQGSQQKQPNENNYYNKFINSMEKVIKNQENKETPNLQIQSFNFVCGINKGIKTVELIQDKICKAVGANVFIDNLIKPSIHTIDQSHIYDINYLRYDENSQTLYSGASNGKRSEIILWKYSPKDKEILRNHTKITLPSSCLSIYCIFVVKNCLFCITKCSIQKESQLLKLQLQPNLPCKKMKSILKIKKVINVLIGQTIYIINEQGLHKLNENGLHKLNEAYQLISIYQSIEILICSENIDQQNIMLGFANGAIQIFNAQSKQIIKQIKLTNNRITIIKATSIKNQFIASTNKRQLLLFQIDPSFKEYTLIQTIKLGDLCKNILVGKKNVYCCLQKGKIQQYTFIQQKLKKINNVIENKFYDQSPDQQKTPQIKQIVFNKKHQTYIYFYINSIQINLLKVNQQRIVNITRVKLNNPIHLIDSCQNLVASIITNKQQFLELYDLDENKTIPILQNLSFAQCTCVKFNPSGDKLALGFKNCQIAIYEIKDSEKLIHICKNQFFELADYKHHLPICNIIWNLQGNAIKTFSQNNLLYYYISNKNDQYLLLLMKGDRKKLKQVKNIIQKSQWIQMGKFNWRNQTLLKNNPLVGQYKQFKQTKDYIFASQLDGTMKIYNNPINQITRKNCQNLRWFRQPYQYLIINKDTIITMLIYCKNIIFSANLKIKIDHQ